MNLTLCLLLTCLSNTNTEGETPVPRLESAERVVAVKGGGYFPVLIKMHDGALGAAVRGGAPHLGIEGRLDWIHSEDGGKTWSEPAVIVDSEFDDRNPAVGQMPDGSIVMAYGETNSYNSEGKYDTSVGGFTKYYVRSTDKGKTWSKKRLLPPNPVKGGSPFGRIILLPDGTALMSLYGGYDTDYTGPVEVPEGTGRVIGILRSTDNGETWGDFSIVSATIHNETSLAYLPDGRLLAVMRTYNDASIQQSESTDGGYTWAKPTQVTLPSQHPGDMCLLQNGDLLLVHGNRIKPYGVGALLSHDSGKTWEHDKRFMIAWTSLNTDCGYPSVVQLDDGTIVVIYYSVGTEDISNDEMTIVVRYSY